MNLTKKQKSDIVFWVVAVGLVVFLFFTPWGMETRAWLMSWTLRSPTAESSSVEDPNKSNVGMDWMILTDEGEKVWLSDIDKPIFLNIWATWCGPCRTELPSILELREKYKSDIEFILISPSETEEVIHQFKMDHEYSFDLYVNGSAVPENLSSSVFPTTFIIDKNKQIKYKFEGAYDWMEESVFEMLDKL